MIQFQEYVQTEGQMGVQWDTFKASNQTQVTHQPFITLIFDFIKGQLP